MNATCYNLAGSSNMALLFRFVRATAVPAGATYLYWENFSQLEAPNITATILIYYIFFAIQRIGALDGQLFKTPNQTGRPHMGDREIVL